MSETRTIATCGSCGLSWDDSTPTAWTPAPSGRCPFEYFHQYDTDGEPITLEPGDVPADFEIRPVHPRLEYLRGQIEAECISYGEISELQDLAEYIDEEDTILLGWAGVPEPAH